MRIVFTICIVFIFNLNLSAQKYSEVLNFQLADDDLSYMPQKELRLLKNELVAVKGADIQLITSKTDQLLMEGTTQFLDEISEANLSLIKNLEQSRKNISGKCSEKELFQVFLNRIESQQKIPLYLQNLFFNTYQSQHANIYLIHVSDEFYTVGVSTPKACESCELFHIIYTFTKDGKPIYKKPLKGLVTLKDSNTLEQIINPSEKDAVSKSYKFTKNGEII